MNIDFSKNKQVIEGFGSFAGRALPLFMNEERDKIVEMLFSPEGLGLSLIRIKVSPYLVSFADIPKDLSIDDPYFDPTQWNELSENEKEYREQLWIVLKAKSFCPTIKVIASTWTPPLAMKTYPTEQGQGPNWYNVNMLKSECYNAFSDYLVEKFIIPCQTAGIFIEALSFQNEPEFPTPNWDGCVWFPWQTAKFIGNLDAKIKEKNLTTKIMVGETANSILADLYWFIVHRFKNSELVNIVATHGYSFPGKGGYVSYNKLQLPWPLTRSSNQQRYVTEISSTYPYDSTIKNALDYAVSMHKFLTLGDINGFIFWLGMVGKYSNEALIVLDTEKNLVFSKVFDVYGQFSRYVLPGSTRVTVDKGFLTALMEFFFGQKVYVSAYKRTIQESSINSQELTIVLANTSTQEKSVTMNLKGISPSTSAWESTLTDATHRWEPNSVKLDVKPGKLSVTIPDNSVVTLKNEGVEQVPGVSLLSAYSLFNSSKSKTSEANQAVNDEEYTVGYSKQMLEFSKAAVRKLPLVPSIFGLHEAEDSAVNGVTAMAKNK